LVILAGKLANEDLFNLKSLADQVGGKAYLYSHMAGGEMTTVVGVGAGTNFGAMSAETTIVVVAPTFVNMRRSGIYVKQAADYEDLIVLNPLRPGWIALLRMWFAMHTAMKSKLFRISAGRARSAMHLAVRRM
jgi:hypothetical protein